MVFMRCQMLVVPDAGEERGNENDASTYENADVKFGHALRSSPPSTTKGGSTVLVPPRSSLVLDALNENVNGNQLLGKAIDQCRCVLFDQNALLDQTSEGAALSVALGGGVEVVEGEGDAVLP